MQHDVNVFGETGQRFIGGVIDDFLDDVCRRIGAGVHARPLAHGFEPLEDTEGGFVVTRVAHGVKRQGDV